MQSTCIFIITEFSPISIPATKYGWLLFKKWTKETKKSVSRALPEELPISKSFVKHFCKASAEYLIAC